MSSALVVGSWQLQSIPPGWDVLPGFGIRRAADGSFPSMLLMAEEPLPSQTTLDRYIANQVGAAKVLFKQPKIKGPDPASIPEAIEAQRLGISYRSADGRNVVQLQFYATDGILVGNVTFTTIEEELPNLSDTLRNILGNLRFKPSPARPPS